MGRDRRQRPRHLKSMQPPPRHAPRSNLTGSSRVRVFVILAAAAALASLFVRGEVLWLLGGVILPVAAAIGTSNAATAKPRRSAYMAGLVGGVYAAGRAAVSWFQFYALGWGAATVAAAGYRPVPTNIVTVSAVVTSELALSLVRVVVAVAGGLAAQEIRLRVSNNRVQR